MKLPGSQESRMNCDNIKSITSFEVYGKCSLQKLDSYILRYRLVHRMLESEIKRRKHLALPTTWERLKDEKIKNATKNSTKQTVEFCSRKYKPSWFLRIFCVQEKLQCNEVDIMNSSSDVWPTMCADTKPVALIAERFDKMKL